MFGRMLKVDLSTGNISKEQMPAQWVNDFIGGQWIWLPVYYGITSIRNGMHLIRKVRSCGLQVR